MDFSNLDLTLEVADKIKDYLKIASSMDELLEASFHLAQIYLKYKMYSEAVSALIPYINDDVKKKYRDYYKTITSFVSDIYYNTGNYDDAVKYLYKNKDVLPLNEIYKANIKLVDILLLDDKINDAISICLSLIRENLDKEEILKIYSILIKYYLDLKKYDEALVYVRKLKENTYEIYDEAYYTSLYFEAYALLKINEPKNTYKIIKDVIDNRMFLSDDLIVKSYVLEFMALVDLKEYKKAINKEAEYESYVLESNYDVKKMFFESCVKLYTESLNRPSLDLYTNRLNELVKPNDIKKTISKKEIKIIKQEVKEIKEELKNDNVEKIIHKDELYKENRKIMYDVVSNINTLYSEVLKQKIDTKIRNNILNVLIQANKIVKFDVCVIVNNNNRHDGFYYKKDRLYERDYKNILNTIVYECIKDKNEHVFALKSELKGYRDIYLDEQYEYTDIASLDAFPIIEKGEVKAVIYFYSFDELLNTGFNYELLKFTVSLVTDRLLNSNALTNYHKDYDIFDVAYKNLNMYLKCQKDDKVILNNKLRDLIKDDLNITNNELTFNEYMIGVDSEYYKDYKDYINGKNETFEYKYFNHYFIEEKKVINDIIISIITDKTLEVVNKEKENELIYNDNETKTFNMYRFNLDIVNFMNNEKFSLLYLNIKTIKRISDCYGFDYASLVIRNTANCIKEFLCTNLVYHVSKDEFIIILDGMNDSRSVERKAVELIEFLRLHVNKKSSRIEAKFLIGAVRYKAQTLIKNPSLLVDYAYFALKCANYSENSFAYFDNDLYKKSFDDTILASNINEAIDTSKVVVSYNQVVDLDKMNTAFYFIKPTIDFLNNTSEDIYNTVNLRGLTTKFEIFLIRKAVSEILNTYDKKKKYIRISLRTNYDTIKSPNFFSLMKRLVVENKIPKGLILFELYGKRKDIKAEVDELSNIGIKFISTKLEDVLLYNISYFKINYLLPHLKEDKGLKVLDALRVMGEALQIKIIIDKVETKDIKYLKELNIDYVSYGAMLSIDDILKQME